MAEGKRIPQIEIDSLAAVMASEADYKQLQQQVMAQDHRAAIQTASRCIKRHESFLDKYRAELSLDREKFEAHGRNLVTFYGVRATQCVLAANQGSSDQKELFDMAEADVREALSLPPGCFQGPEARSTLLKTQELIQDARRTSKSGSCFIATAAYGSPMAPEVSVLRRFRDVRLKPYRSGRWLVNVYERCSPPLADAIASRPAARLWVRRLLLTPIIKLVSYWIP